MRNIKSTLLTVIAVSIIFLSSFSSVKTTQLVCNDTFSPEKNNEIEYDLLILSPKIFTKDLEPLVHHKNNVGIKTVLIDVETVYQKIIWRGRDNAEKIKFFIKDSIENWNIKYVLLVGGLKGYLLKNEEWWIPVRYSHIEDTRYSQFEERKFISDLYFADIYDSEGNFSSWDTNNNDVFGEWYTNKSADDVIDLFPDVYLGRLPCRNIFDVKILVKKIIGYEKNKNDDTWFKKMVVVAGDTYPNRTESYEGEKYTQFALDCMGDFQHVKLWISNGNFKNWIDVVQEINKGCGFIYFSGHGSPINWGTYDPECDKLVYGLNNVHMVFLKNRYKLPVVVVGGCHNNMFNNSLFNASHTYGIPTLCCWSWKLIKNFRGGSIATIGVTGFSYGPTDLNSGLGGSDWLDMHFFEIYAKEKIGFLGEIWAATISSFLQNVTIDWDEENIGDSCLNTKNVQIWMLMGDPSLKIGGYI